jgi:hypothetical protein
MGIDFGWANQGGQGQGQQPQSPQDWGHFGDHGGDAGQNWNEGDWRRAQQLAGQGLSGDQITAALQADRDRAYHAGIANSFRSDAQRAGAAPAAGKFKNFYIDPVTGAMQVYDGTAWNPVAAGTDYYSQFDESIQRAHPKDWFSSQMEQASGRTPEFDPTTGTYHFRDSAGAWQDSSVADIYSKLSPYQQSLHSKDWYQDQATQASDSYNNMQRRQLDSRVGDAQRFGNMSTPQYRYPAGGI